MGIFFTTVVFFSAPVITVATTLTLTLSLTLALTLARGLLGWCAVASSCVENVYEVAVGAHIRKFASAGRYVHLRELFWGPCKATKN